MSPESQRIAIAEACGWTKIGDWVGLRGPHGHKPGNPFGCLTKLPDYLADLNAMHEASVNMLCLKKTIVYQDHICAILRREALASEQEARIMCIDATTAQRAEAFLRTIGKWPASPPSGPKEAGE